MAVPIDTHFLVPVGGNFDVDGVRTHRVLSAFVVNRNVAYRKHQCVPMHFMLMIKPPEELM